MTDEQQSWYEENERILLIEPTCMTMSRKASSFLLMLCLSMSVFAQKYFQLMIKLDTSINPQKVKYQYHDGKTMQFISDTLSNKRQVLLEGSYFSTYASFNISYITNENQYYSSDFLLNDKQASISFRYAANPDQILLYDQVVNAMAVYDTVANKTYRALTQFNKTQNWANYQFAQAHASELNSNDSLRKVYLQMLKSTDMRSMQLLKSYADDYFSFWYFLNNIVPRAHLLGNEPSYLSEQLAYFKSTFPKKFQNSTEGQEYLKANERIIHATKVNDMAPLFGVKDVYGKNISLAKLKGKYVLLDFWATWCGPCVKEIPFIKSLRKTYPSDKLAIVSISEDRDLTKLKQFISQQEMNWYHFFDKETDISKLYSVFEYPTLLLINKQGKVIYKSDHVKNDQVEIAKILNCLTK